VPQPAAPERRDAAAAALERRDAAAALERRDAAAAAERVGGQRDVEAAQARVPPEDPSR
jgi:hypothetical protein